MGGGGGCLFLFCFVLFFCLFVCLSFDRMEFSVARQAHLRNQHFNDIVGYLQIHRLH